MLTANEYDDSYQFKEILAQLRSTTLVLGNWKHLPTSFTDAKCAYKDVTFLENVVFFPIAECCKNILKTEILN